MKINALVLVLAAAMAGCSTPPPATAPGTDGRSPDQLALIVIESDQVKLDELDGKPQPGSGTSNFYVPPGAHRFQVRLNWCPGGLCTVYGGYADKPRMACVDAKAGMRYRFTAANPGPDWAPRVTEQQGNGDPKTIDARCT